MEAIQDISGCADNQKVKYSVGSLTSRALTWWNSEVRIRGREAAVGMTWEDFKAFAFRMSSDMGGIMRRLYANTSHLPNQGRGGNLGKVVKLQWVVGKMLRICEGRVCQARDAERLKQRFWSHSMGGVGQEIHDDFMIAGFVPPFWSHSMGGVGHAAYTDRFHELARLVPHLVTLETKRIERYIYGLAPQIRGMVAATDPSTVQSAILKVGVLTDEAVRNGSLKRSGERRGDDEESIKEGNVKGDNKRKMCTNHVLKQNHLRVMCPSW
ncbi:hypothetical protein Tco_0155396 [Tanacetum coccineum]